MRQQALSSKEMPCLSDFEKHYVESLMRSKVISHPDEYLEYKQQMRNQPQIISPNPAIYRNNIKYEFINN
jgi:hypothetical protein